MKDASFAERYLGLLNDRDGARSYFEADLMSYTKHLHNKHLYLVHGTLDEKYQVSHSFLIAKSLIEKRFYFHQQVIVDCRSHKNAHLFHY